MKSGQFHTSMFTNTATLNQNYLSYINQAKYNQNCSYEEWKSIFKHAETQYDAEIQSSTST